MRGKIPRSTGWLRAVLYALALHLGVVALLVVSFRFVSKDTAHGPVMQAVIVREVSEQDKPQDQARQEQLRKEQERKQREADAQRVEEESKRQETERVRVETERKQQDEIKKKEEAQHKKQEQDKKQEELQRKKQADAEKRKSDDERKKQDKQRQQQAEQSLREQLEAEEKAQAAARTARRAPEADKYRAAIRQKVERNWVPPADSRKGIQCTVHVRQTVGGEVLDAKAVCPDAAFKRSVEAAVHKASPLPTPETADLFDRDIEFIFRPGD